MPAVTRISFSWLIKMAPVMSLLVSTLLVVSLTLAAPVQNDAGLETNKRSVSSAVRVGVDGKNSRRTRTARLVAGARRKREVLAEDEPDDDSIDQQLAQLSDDQLAALAKIVQQKLNEYDPSVPFDNYRIVELPDDMFVNQIEDYEEPYEEELFMPTRPKRSQPIDEAVVVIPEDELQDMIEEQEQLDEQPQVIVVPEEMIQEDDEEVPVSDEVLDELELRERIAELATILNERANRGL